MNLISPWSLVWLAPLAAAIILLYLLKLRRQPRAVSSVILWRQAISDLQANAPFQKLRRNLLLYLQLLALLAMVAAVARPFVRVRGLEGQRIVLIIDASASMKATDVSGSRFSLAKQIALKAVDDLGRGDAMAVIAASAQTRVVSPFTADRRALAAAIRALACTDTTSDLRDAVRLADSMCARGAGGAPAPRPQRTQIVIVSDGALPPLTDPLGSGAQLTFSRVGRRGDNLAITALGARRSLAGDEHSVLVAAESFSPQRRTFTIELWLDDQLVDARERTLAPGGRAAEVFSLPSTGGGLVAARLDVRDDLAADNAAWISLAPRRRASVLLLTKGDLFLERALALDPALSVVKAAGPPTKVAAYDMVVVEGVSADRLPPARGYLFINAAGEQAPVEITGELSQPTITDWSRRDPITRHLDLGGVRIASARRARLKPWGRALAEADGSPVVAAGERGGARSIWVGWDLLASDFPLRVAFPIFLANCVDWLAPAAALRTGDVISITPPAGLSRLRLTDPAGRAVELPGDQGPVAIKDTAQAGVYTLEGEGFRQQFGVSLLSSDESRLMPAERLTIAGRPFGGHAGAVPTNKELWRWLVIAALGLITIEWFAYHRRP